MRETEDEADVYSVAIVKTNVDQQAFYDKLPPIFVRAGQRQSELGDMLATLNP